MVIMAFSVYGQERFTLSGYVKDKSSGETMIGASVITLGDKKMI